VEPVSVIEPPVSAPAPAVPDAVASGLPEKPRETQKPAAATPPARPAGSLMRPPASNAPMRPMEYIGPGGIKPMRTLGPKPSPSKDLRRPPADGTKDAGREAVARDAGRSDAGRNANAPRTSPSVRMGKMPEPPKSKLPPKPAEPVPQKPIVKLPASVIKDTVRSGGGAFAQPLKDHIRKFEEQKATEDARPATPGGRPKPARPGAPATTPAPAGTTPTTARPRRPSDVEEESPTGKNLIKKLRKDAEAERRKLARLLEEEGGENKPSRTRRNISRKVRGQSTAAPRKSNVVVELPVTVRSLSEALSIPAGKMISKLMQLGVMANMNSQLEDETAELVATEFGVEAEFRRPVDVDVETVSAIEGQEDAAENLVLRAPVVTFLGHVDHGKTSLLDKIIGINVASGESGGITQHIRAYQIQKNGQPITFVDTPGHEAFTEMRARGATVTDIAVLVVAADDGVMPQTEEALSHARAAEVPIVVALNKSDLPGTDSEKILHQLAVNGLQPSDWGGDVEVIRTSALTGAGIENLLDTLLTIAELHNLKANPDRAALGTCLEAEMHEGRGVIAKLLVQNGTLKNGDIIVCGTAYGRVKAMYDTLKPRETHESVGPSYPVNVTGLDEPPGAGERFYVLDDITQAREIAEQRRAAQKSISLAGPPKEFSLETWASALQDRQVSTLNLILRADTRGSIEAIKKELQKLHHEEVQIKLLQTTVGGISEADVHLASVSNAIILGFNVVGDEKARNLAKARGVEIRRYDVIYEITDHIRKALEGKLKPEQRTVELGRALVKKVFNITRVGQVAGCHVLSGTIEKSSRSRLIRDNRIVGDYALDSLKREKDDVREVRQGYECGIRLANFNDLKEGDVLEIYKTESVARTL